MPQDRIGLGVVARDDKGKILMAAAKSQHPCSSVEMAELLAAEWTVRLAAIHGWTNVLIEGDASGIIDALNHKYTRNLYAQTLVDNIGSLHSNFSSISYSHCYREGNNVAHHIAKWASCSTCSIVWDVSFPSWIHELVCLDLIP